MTASEASKHKRHQISFSQINQSDVAAPKNLDDFVKSECRTGCIGTDTLETALVSSAKNKVILLENNVNFDQQLARDFHSFGPSPFIGHTPTTNVPLLMPTVMPETLRSGESTKEIATITSERAAEMLLKEEPYENKTARDHTAREDNYD